MQPSTCQRLSTAFVPIYSRSPSTVAKAEMRNEPRMFARLMPLTATVWPGGAAFSAIGCAAGAVAYWSSEPGP